MVDHLYGMHKVLSLSPTQRHIHMSVCEHTYHQSNMMLKQKSSIRHIEKSSYLPYYIWNVVYYNIGVFFPKLLEEAFSKW